MADEKRIRKVEWGDVRKKLRLGTKNQFGTDVDLLKSIVFRLKAGKSCKKAGNIGKMMQRKRKIVPLNNMLHEVGYFGRSVRLFMTFFCIYFMFQI